nr:hypothetical protein GCM10020185_88390 [Pseudomonas brassicacearum subsp. brassicacearum]
MGEVQMSRIVDVKAGEFARFVAKGSCAVLFFGVLVQALSRNEAGFFNELAEKAAVVRRIRED